MNFEEYKEKIELILKDNKDSFDEFKNIQQYKESVNNGKQTGNYEIPEGVDAINDAFLNIGMYLHKADKELNSAQHKDLKNFVLAEIGSTKNPANLNKVIRIAGHEGIQKNKDKLPKGWGTLAIISQLKESEFKLFINNEKVNPNVPRSVISSLVKECQGKIIIKKITIEVDLKSKNTASREDVISMLKTLPLEDKGWKINIHEGKKSNKDNNSKKIEVIDDEINTSSQNHDENETA